MNRVIFFTKAPNLTNSKKRLKGFLSEDERLQLMVKLIEKNFNIVNDFSLNPICYYQGNHNDISFINCPKIPQNGSDLGQKMKNAIYRELESYNKVVLIGSDIENFDKEYIKLAFSKLDDYDVVIGPSIDGGYGLIGLKEKLDIFSDIIYSTENVVMDTVLKINNLDKSYYILEPIRDIDTMKDIIIAEFDDEGVVDLGHGEYNLNYRLGEKVIRINLASQIGLGNKQLKYEYDALKVLEKSKVTPIAYEYYDNGRYLSKPFMTMEYVEGRALDYSKDMDIAARLLSSVHNLDTDFSSFLWADKPFLTMYEEFIKMFSCYQAYENRDIYVVDKISRFLEIAKSTGLDTNIENPCIINTELNNRNFIIGDRSVIIDWEKPIIGECEQDLAHFLVPTTTNWKTDTILTEEEMLSFLKTYEKYRSIDYDKFYKYLMFNSLRGITWCSMAKVEYDKGRFLTNDESLIKINKFLSKDFLQMLEKFYRI